MEPRARDRGESDLAVRNSQADGFVGWQMDRPFRVVTADSPPVSERDISARERSVLRGAHGKSHISMEGFAIADEVEPHAHRRERFTGGY